MWSPGGAGSLSHMRQLLLAALMLAASSARAEEDLRYADANTDRVILYSTAETHPAGTFYFSDYEIILLQVGYAPTDNFQISLTGVPPLVTDQPYFFDITGKLNVLRTPRFRAALQFAGDVLVIPNSGPNVGSLFGVRAGAIGQVCFDSGCLSSLTFNAGTLLNDKSNEVVPIYLAAGLIAHLNDTVKLLVEPNYAVAVGNGSIDGPKGFLLNYGLRISGRQFGFDLAFVRPFGDGSSSFVLGFPLISFTYRTDTGRRHD